MEQQIQTNLIGYVEVYPENYIDIEIGCWVRYITHEGKYRSGGILIKNNSPIYFVLKNPYSNITWSINLSKNIIFLKNMREFKKQNIEKNNLYKLYQAGLVKILDKPEN